MREIYNLLIFSGFERIFPQRLWARSSVQLLQSLHDCRWNVSGWWITRDKSDQSSKTTSNVEFVGIIVEMTDGIFWKEGKRFLIISHLQNPRWMMHYYWKIKVFSNVFSLYLSCLKKSFCFNYVMVYKK